MDLNKLYRDEGLAFLLSRINLAIYEPLHAYEDIEASTWCSDARGYTFPRYFRLSRNGKVVAEALSTWALIDTSTHSLVRANEFQRDFPMDEPIDASRLPARVHIPTTMEFEHCGNRKIVYSDIDFNGHMNNTKYPDMICDFLPDMKDKWVSSVSMSYLKEATHGDVLDIYLSRVEASESEEEKFLFRTKRPDGTSAFEAAITLRKKEN